LFASTGIITTVAGTGTAGFSGDGGPATSAKLNFWTSGLAVDAANNLYIADDQNHRIRKVNASTGIITTVVGTGTSGFSGDGGPATSAKVNRPVTPVLDSAGNIYFADDGNRRIRKVTASTGVITTIAGTGATGFSGDGGPATSASFDKVRGLALDTAGNLYISEQGSYRVRKITGSTGIITTVVGTGTSGFSGDGGPATSANCNSR
jgi:sugar lactone lactonase YvrE